MRIDRRSGVSSTEHGIAPTLGQRLRVVVANRTEEILAEVAPTLRRLRTFLLVVTITVPAFLTGLLVVLWRIAR